MNWFDDDGIIICQLIPIVFYCEQFYAIVGNLSIQKEKFVDLVRLGMDWEWLKWVITLSWEEKKTNHYCGGNCAVKLIWIQTQLTNSIIKICICFVGKQVFTQAHSTQTMSDSQGLSNLVPDLSLEDHIYQVKPKYWCERKW